MRAKSLLPIFGILAFTDANAASGTTSMAVSAIVHDVCAVAATPVAFGNYESGSSSVVNARGQVNVSCTVGTAYTVGLSGGTSANTAQRELSNGANGSLDYNLYQDAAYSVVWGDSAGVNTVSGTYTTAQQPLEVYGRISGGQAAAAGSYSDTITVTITY